MEESREATQAVLASGLGGDLVQSTTEWAQANFGECDLGDQRRTNRLVAVAETIANNPSSSLPNQFEHWGDLKAVYRLFDCEEVSFEAVARPHWERTKRAAQGRVLVIGDTTELDFGFKRRIEGIGPTGSGSGKGFLLHNALMVNADSEEILGIAGQVVYYRKPKKKGKRLNAAQRMKKNRESQIWGMLIDQLGEARPEAQYVHVYDRGADNFEVYCRLQLQRGDWVIRASKLSRYVFTEASEKPVPLKKALLHFKRMGSYTLSLRARGEQPAREAKLEVRVGQVKLPPPRFISPWVRKLAPAPIAMNVIEVVEIDPPVGVIPIRWVLLTSLPVKTFQDAWNVIGYYELRWLVEEYHKALKTGCRVESRQLKEAGRLEAFVALTSVVAVRLLQLKSLARTQPDVPASRTVPPIWLKMLKLARKNLSRVHDLTIGQFYREVAKLGGFLARKGDGEPGWITIWRGWEKLNMFVFVAGKLKIET
jgi:Transposase DNA-binding/Transposase Tn5 dimerisation domain